MSICGMVRGLMYGLIRGVNDGDGLARRYSDRRASVSRLSQYCAVILRLGCRTFLVRVEHILVRVAQGKLVRDRRLATAVLRSSVIRCAGGD